MSAFDEKNESRDAGAPVNLFEFRGAEDVENVLERLIRSVNIGSGAGEFGYGTTPVRRANGTSENVFIGGSRTDFMRSVDQLMERVPNLSHVNLGVSWFGNDLRCEHCEIRPKVEHRAS